MRTNPDAVCYENEGVSESYIRRQTMLVCPHVCVWLVTTVYGTRGCRYMHRYACMMVWAMS